MYYFDVLSDFLLLEEEDEESENVEKIDLVENKE